MRKNRSELKFILLAAITIDGKIAKNSYHLTDWTSPEDKVHFRTKMKECDVLLMGHNTYNVSKNFLKEYNCIIFSKKIPKMYMENFSKLYLNLDTVPLLENLEKKKYKKIGLLGGTQIYSYFLKIGLIDEMYITVEPLIFGRGLDLFDCENDYQKSFQLKSYKQLNEEGTVLLHYVRKN